MLKRYHSYNLSFFLLFIFTIISIFVSAQNPFDIQSRNQDENPAKIETQKKVTTENPFDIKESKVSQRYPSKQAPEIKQSVNEQTSTISRPWRIAILLLSIFSFVGLRMLNLKGFQSLLESLLSSIKMMEYRNSINGQFNLQIALYYLFFISNLTYFIYLITIQKSIQIPYIIGNVYISIFLGILAVYVIKYIVLYLLEYGMSIRRVIQNHLFSVSIHNIALGSALFLINAFLAFTDAGLFNTFMWLGIILIVLVYIIRQLKGVLMLGELRHFSILHFFIYLCSCEIAPVLVGLKFITG